MRVLLLLLTLQPAIAAVQPIRSGCSPDDAQVATVSADDHPEVLMALAGDGQTCYRVAVVKAGARLTGYVLGETLPAVKDFVRQREKESQAAAEAQARLALAAPVGKSEATASAPPSDPAISTQFEDFSGRDTRGKAVNLASLKARVVLVTFWSPKSKLSQGELTSVMPLYNQFHNSGLAAVGVSMDPNPDHISEALDDVTPNFPQMPDRTGLGALYHVDPGAGKTFVLDSSHRVVAVGTTGPEIEKAVRQLLAAPEAANH